MKSKFWGYVPLGEEDYCEIWKDSKIVLDTNILLNLYRYSKSTQKEVLRILDENKEKFIIPNTIIKEFFENREEVITEHNNIKQKIIKDFGIENIKKQIKSYKHLSLDTKELNEIVDDFEHKIDNFLDMCKTEDFLGKDTIIDKISEWFDGKVIDELKDINLEEIYKEGQSRYEKSIPPGYKDEKKPSPKKYNDFIIWKQIIKYATREKSNILFISDDMKEDWIRNISGKKIGPREELLNEFFIETNGQKIYIYSTKGFLDSYPKYNKTTNKIDEDTIFEVENIENEAIRRAAEYLIAEKRYNENLDDKNHMKYFNNINKKNDVHDNEKEFNSLTMIVACSELEREIYVIEREIEDITEKIFTEPESYNNNYYKELLRIENRVRRFYLEIKDYDNDHYHSCVKDFRSEIKRLKIKSIPF